MDFSAIQLPVELNVLSPGPGVEFNCLDLISPQKNWHSLLGLSHHNDLVVRVVLDVFRDSRPFFLLRSWWSASPDSHGVLRVKSLTDQILVID